MGELHRGEIPVFLAEMTHLAQIPGKGGFFQKAARTWRFGTKADLLGKCSVPPQNAVTSCAGIAWHGLL